MKQVTAYKCDFCHRCFGRPVDAHNHEQGCRHGPHRRHCRTCVHGITSVVEWIGYPIADIPVFGPWCDFHDKDMREKPYFIDCETNGVCEDWSPEETEINKPGTCEHYEYKSCSGWTK